MANTNEVGVGLVALGLAAALSAGIFTGRSAAELVEEDIARFAASAESARRQGAAPAADRAPAEDHDLTRYKIAVTHAQPTQGPSDALVTIVEFCELYGARCRATDALLSAAIEDHPLEVRRVFRASGFATRADERALEVAHAAQDQGKFWELRERLASYDAAPSLAELRAAADAAGMDWSLAQRALDRRTYSSAIAADRALARTLGLRGGAIVHVNGRPLEGELTAEKLDAAIQDEAARARRLMDDGALREDIYAEIIKPAMWRPIRSSSL